VEIFGDHASPCNSGFGNRHPGTQSYFCQVLTHARVPNDHELDVAGNGRRPADILLKVWDGRRDLAVDLTIVLQNPATGRHIRGSASTFLRDNGKIKTRASADSCGRMGVDFSPMVYETWGGAHGAGNEVVKEIFASCTASLLLAARNAAVVALRQGLGVQLGRLVARQLEANDGKDGGTGMVGSCTASPLPRLRATRSGGPQARWEPAPASRGEPRATRIPPSARIVT